MSIFTSPSLSFPLVNARVEYLPQENPHVAWFCENGKKLWDSNDLSEFSKLNRRICRTTIVENENGDAIHSPEHLAPLFLLWPRQHFEVHAEAKELPILDGSAWPWYKVLRRFAGRPEALCFYEAPLTGEWKWQNGFCQISPADTLEIEYSIEHGSYQDSAYLAIYEAEDLLRMFSARTFIFKDDYENAKTRGLLSGADESCGLLLNTNSEGKLETLVGGSLRHPQEPIFHKILDLLGDISLPKPILPRLRIRIHNGGHIAHHQILARLLEYVPSRYPTEA